jgi:hypothetical protein
MKPAGRSRDGSKSDGVLMGLIKVLLKILLSRLDTAVDIVETPAVQYTEQSFIIPSDPMCGMSSRQG